MCGQTTPTFNVQCLLGTNKRAYRNIDPWRHLLSQTRIIIFLFSQLCQVPRLDLILLLSCVGGAESHARGVLLVSQARPNIPQRGSLSVSRTGKEILVTLGRFPCTSIGAYKTIWCATCIQKHAFEPTLLYNGFIVI